MLKSAAQHTRIVTVVCVCVRAYTAFGRYGVEVGPRRCLWWQVSHRRGDGLLGKVEGVVGWSIVDEQLFASCNICVFFCLLCEFSGWWGNCAASHEQIFGSCIILHVCDVLKYFFFFWCSGMARGTLYQMCYFAYVSGTWIFIPAHMHRSMKMYVYYTLIHVRFCMKTHTYSRSHTFMYTCIPCVVGTHTLTLCGTAHANTSCMQTPWLARTRTHLRIMVNNNTTPNSIWCHAVTYCPPTHLAWRDERHA